MPIFTLALNSLGCFRRHVFRLSVPQAGHVLAGAAVPVGKKVIDGRIEPAAQTVRLVKLIQGQVGAVPLFQHPPERSKALLERTMNNSFRKK
jgi:hypothetical protein